ncbi:hypothetical protein B9C88_09625 [Brevibacillus laterosporus]|uniref:hypothetical protein n=1 Tax=Brevibacillus laterosporus TaxID=1465 RepID=UPI000BC4A3E8|nr:hypothetical protein [Brevibacillus laterosporus]PCN44465.1 hypothetical protein B9C88_09625 [Brevibacillus laterosporus]
MARSIRVFYSNQQGVSRHNFNWPPINKKSAVLITAAEFFWPGGIGGLEDIRPHLGAASIWVSNVGVHGPEPGSGGVEFLLHVDWPTPLNVMVTITVLDDIEQYHRVN